MLDCKRFLEESRRSWHNAVMGKIGRPQTHTIDGVAKQTYIAWLLTPPRERSPQKLEDLAEQLGVARRTMTLWRTEDKEFIEEWEKQYLRTIGNPGVKSEIMATLLKTATDPDDPKHVQAAKAYFEIEGSLKPVKTQVNVQTGDVKKLTLEELDEMLAAKAQAEKERRLRVVGDGDE